MNVLVEDVTQCIETAKKLLHEGLHLHILHGVIKLLIALTKKLMHGAFFLYKKMQKFDTRLPT